MGGLDLGRARRPPGGSDPGRASLAGCHEACFPAAGGCLGFRAAATELLAGQFFSSRDWDEYCPAPPSLLHTALPTMSNTAQDCANWPQA